MEIEVIKISELKLHKKASELVPEMNVDEWNDFKESVRKHGIRQPIHINMKNEVLDGRHRYLACRDLGIKAIQAIRHDFNEQQEMEFVRDTAIERRNLTVAQKHKIVMSAKELIDGLYEKGRENQLSELKHQKTTFGSREPNEKPTHNTNEEIGKIIGASKATVQRLNRIKKEDEDLYNKVVEGEISTKGAYNKLFDKNKETKPKGGKKADKKVEKETQKEEPIEVQIFNANVITLINHLNEVSGFIERNDDYKEIIKEAIKKDEASMTDFKEALQKIINEMGEI